MTNKELKTWRRKKLREKIIKKANNIYRGQTKKAISKGKPCPDELIKAVKDYEYKKIGDQLSSMYGIANLSKTV